MQDFTDNTLTSFEIFGDNPRRGSTGGSFGNSGVLLNGDAEA